MIAAFIAKHTTRIIVGVALIAALLLLVTCEIKRRSDIADRRAEIDASMRDASERAGKHATDASISAIERQAEREKQTSTNREKINEAENAKDSAGAAGNAGFNVMCERASYRNHPACVQRPHPASNPR